MPQNQNRQTQFNELVLGFSSAALYYLGLSEVDGEMIAEKNKTLAEYNLEVLRLLKQKTKGNLHKDEEQLLMEVISDLKEKIAQS